MLDYHGDVRDRFWSSQPQLPIDLRLERHEPVAVSQPGPRGTAIYDILRLTTPTTVVELLAAYQPRLFAGRVGKLKAQLESLASQRRERQGDLRQGTPHELSPAIITDVATPSVIEACKREGVALFDQKGTAIVGVQGVFVHVEGKGVVERPWRGRLFSGKASRIVRFLLTEVALEPNAEARSVQAFASKCELSYVYAHHVLTKLEREGFLERKTSHGGFRLKRPVDLLRTWIDSGERTAVAVEGFYCAATTPEALAAGAAELVRRGAVAPLFSLASALDSDQIHVGGLPHGVYWTGELGPIIDAFGLKRVTPHNLLVLRPDPVAWSAAGGILPVEVASVPVRRVALPQLAVDFAGLAGRGREQADFLVDVFGKRLPYRLEAP
jgi:hypothetical protein